MNANELATVDQLRAFLGGAQRVAFEVASDKDARYGWIRKTLVQFRYLELCKPDKGVVLRYLVKVSGYSRQQVTRLVKQYRDTGRLARRQRAVKGFRRRYTPEDVRLLAAMDERHNTPNGLTAKKLCERAYEVFGQREYQRLAGVSVSHLYNLRKSAGYRRCRLTVHKTRPRSVAIGERRAPRPEGRPGFLRVDTVHQGDWDGHKGVYHINTVDEVTQMQAIASVEKISERYPYASLMTPYEKLRSLPSAQAYLKPGLNFQSLGKIACQQSDNEAADRLQKARRQLFDRILYPQRKQA